MAAKITKEDIKEVAKTVEQTVEEKKPVVEKAVKEAAVKAEKTAKETTKKAKAVVEKAKKKFEPKKTAVVFEAYGRSYNYDDIVKVVNKACKNKTAKKLEIYVNAGEGAAYYVLDGEGSVEYKVQL